MNPLEKKILEEGTVLPENILKVDRFINHMIDPQLFTELADEFYERFKDKKIDKILTLEVSGIGIAFACGVKFETPVVFAKKTVSKTLGDNVYKAQVYSYTKDINYDIMVAKDFLEKGERILIIDDFLANGKAIEGLISLCEQAGATVEGIGILIEKAFQDGGKIIREQGYKLESLARIKNFDNGIVNFV
ncbi:xanthine phosphoribosyltransferase [Miniphocaeibacter massiliensis]|uniref:xanthine phosphoribosyltransferase n=1 Tax=Miniphocaeibacter massiliensis TaxID=2041841 RepID=UPI000C1BAE91|nr:xanthine phosphoribosyltransferase [Miniphocaeibacter massiliensis]